MTRNATIAALLASVSALPAIAQDISTDSGAEFIGSVTLGESRRGIQTDSAASETVLDQEEIDTRQAGTVADLLDTIPNVDLLNGSTPQGGGVSIRGLGSQAGLYGTDGKISVVVDGVTSGAEEVYRNGAMLALEPELFKQLSVTRGPSKGFRYSSGAAGGTIEATSKDATDFVDGGDPFAFRQRFGYESNGDAMTTSSVLAFAPSDSFDVLGFYAKRQVNDRIDGEGNVLGGTAFEQTSYMVKGNYRPTDASRLTFAHIYNEVPEQDAFYNVFDPNIDTFFGTVDRFTKDTTTYLEYGYNPDNSSLVDMTLRLEHKLEEVTIDPIFNPFRTTLLEADHKTETKTLRLDNVARFDTGNVGHTLSAGIAYSQRERSSITDSGLNATSAPGGTDDALAIYLADEMRIGDRLTFTPQLRYESQTLTAENNDETSMGMPANGTSFKSNAITGAVSLKYDLSDQVSVFGTWAYNENLPILDDFTNGFISQSEKATTREVGLSYDGYDVFTAEDSLKAKLTYFETSITDGTTYSGIAGVDLNGLELELSYANPAFYLDLAAGRTRGEVTEASLAARVPATVGDYFNYTPADTLQLTLGKRFFDDQLDVSLETTHTAAHSRTTALTGALAPSEAYTLYDLNIGYTPDTGAMAGFEFRASVENLTNETYRKYGSSRNGMGRNYVFGISKTF